MSTIQKENNRRENRNLGEEKRRFYGLGRRDRRRLLSGKRLVTTPSEKMFLIDMNREDLIPREK